MNYPGNDTFLVGPKECVLDEKLLKEMNYPMIVFNAGGLLATYVSDPEVVFDM